jgi:hypothetical protein
MQQLIKRFSWVGLLALGLQGAGAFSLGGPIGNNPNPSGGAGIEGDAWQQPVIGYGLPGDANAPKNLGEEYRRNVQVLYYACDANFVGYFGSNGVSAVDGAFAILNNLTNVDGYSPDLSEFPLETRHYNYEAQALGLFDLKSQTLGLLVEQLGLDDPVRYDWTLHDRVHISPGPACPGNMEYLVVQRNFDITTTPFNQLQYSPYVNDTLYSYFIEEFCTAPLPPQAVTVPFAVDPLADTYSPVASYVTIGLTYGQFYTGLTRDDVAGLRYLLTTNNVNTESPPANTLLQNTNYNTEQALYTADLGALLSSAQTNPPATLAALFPGLVVGSSSAYLTAATNPVIVSYFTNYNGSPAGSPPVLILYTNGYTYTPVTNYATTFVNVVITTNYFANSYRTNTKARLVTVTVGTLNGAPAGSPLVTNTTTQYITLTNVPSGDYYLIPPGTCGFNIESPQRAPYPIQVVTATTNLITQATNSAGFFYSQSLVIYATNHIFIVNPCTLTPSPPALYQGIGRMQFVRADFDSLLGQYWQPITNTITMVSVTNSQAVKLTFQRVVTTPDFTFSAADITAGPSSTPNPYVSLGDRGLTFDQTHALPGLAGPGLITPPTTITYNKVGPVYFNYTGLMDGTPYFTETPGSDGSDSYYTAYFVWASFDGSTNDPVVYPDGMSIQNLENDALVQITPTGLPNGTNGVAFTPTIFTATGGAFTYSPVPTWTTTSLPTAPVSSGLPSGLALVSNPDGTATLSGTPAQSGTFDFYLVMTDAEGRSVQWYYSVTIQ